MKTKTLLYQDLKAIENAKAAVAKNADKLNIFIEMAEREMKTNFTTAQKKNISEEGIEFVNNLVKSKHKFPDADRDFNEKALGLNLKPLREYFQVNHLYWEKYPQEINNEGLFAPIEVDELPEVTRHTKYVENKKQEIALKQAKQLSKILNEMQENSFITPYGHGSKIETVTDIVEYVGLGNKAEFTTNYHKISLMK